MYSEKLNSAKLGAAAKQAGASGKTASETVLHELIDSFCTKESLLGVPTTTVFLLFDEFCKENGFAPLSHLSLGRIFRKHFGLTRKRVRDGQTLHWVYVEK